MNITATGYDSCLSVSLRPDPDKARANSEQRKKDKHMRMLVIDDNHDAANTMRTLLELYGHEVRVAYCGLEGVTIAAEWRPAVVLSDIGLPDINGFSVAEAVRGNKFLQDTTLVAVTAYDTDATQERAYKSGFDLFLAKPADVAALLDTLVAKSRIRARSRPYIDVSPTPIVFAKSYKGAAKDLL